MSETPPPALPAPPAPPPPPPPPNPARHRRHRRLRRDRTHRVLGGVCAGIARTYGIDVVLVRVLFVIAAIAWVGLPVYLVLWIALPARGERPDDIAEPRDMGMLLALILIGIGALIFVRHVLPHSWTNGGGFFAPLLLIGAGVAILVLRRPGIETDEDDENDDTIADDASPVGPQTATTPDASGAADEPTSPSAPTAPTSVLDLAPDDDVPPTAWSQNRPWAHWRTTRRDHRREWRARRPRPFLGPLTFSVLLIGAGVASLLEATGAVDVNLAIVLAIGTCIVGAALVVSAWVGRARGLILLGVLLACAAGVATIVDVPFTGGFGERTYTPLLVRDVQPRYKLGAGTLRLDLSRANLEAATLEVRAQLGAGDMQVTIPPNVRLEIDAHAGAGEVDLLGHVEHGVDVDTQQHLAGVTGDGVLHLILRVGAGHIEVRS
jgi:phage shock protein PspC (stress-responsive transcriptional regulator)